VLKYLTYIGKLAGFVATLNVIPFVDPAVEVLVFAAASLLKDTVNRIGDLVDDGFAELQLQELSGILLLVWRNLFSAGGS
jgi:hypothetical protein